MKYFRLFVHLFSPMLKVFVLRNRVQKLIRRTISQDPPPCVCNFAKQMHELPVLASPANKVFYCLSVKKAKKYATIFHIQLIFDSIFYAIPKESHSQIGNLSEKNHSKSVARISAKFQRKLVNLSATLL